MNPNTHIQLKQNSRQVAQSCDVGMDMQPKQQERALAHSGGLMTPACRVGLDFGSTE